jgi:GWxTD domain-containing protein
VIARAIQAAAVVMLFGCSTWQRVGTTEHTTPEVAVAQLTDANTVYGTMGLWVSGPPLPFVAAVRHLAGPTPDTTLVQFSLSLSSHALTFRRDANGFTAEYFVEADFQPDTGPAIRISTDQSVRVGKFQETLRSDESIIFSHYLPIAPGRYQVSVQVRDRNGPGVGRRDRIDTVPRFGGPALSDPIPFYEGTGRTARVDRPKLLPNARATVPFSRDTLRFYIEAYGLPHGTRLQLRGLDEHGNQLWSDTLPIVDSAGRGFGSVVQSLPADRLDVGRQELVVEALGTGIETHLSYLVSFSNVWAMTNFDEMLSVLRYFDRQDLVAKLRAAPPEKRADAWREFWQATDPVPITPENEALDEYLQRVQLANQRFGEPGTLGWLTDRGEVFITLGDPEEVNELGTDAMRGQPATIRWTYNTLRLVVLFEDRTGFGDYKLTSDSRAAYQEVLARVRRGT